MPLFGRSSNGSPSFFQKVKSGVGSVFGAINKGAAALGRVAGRAGGVLGTLGTIADNPITQAVAGSLGVGDTLGRFSSAVGKGKAVTDRIGSVSGKVEAISSPATYFGQNPVPAIRNAVERAKDIKADVMGGVRVMGGNPATYTPLPRNFA